MSRADRQGDISANCQQFDLVDMDLMAGVHLLIAVDHAGQDNAHRVRRIFMHGMDLPWGGMGTQNDPFLFRIKGVPKITGWVIGRDIEQLEVVLIRFHFS